MEKKSKLFWLLFCFCFSKQANWGINASLRSYDSLENEEVPTWDEFWRWRWRRGTTLIQLPSEEETTTVTTTTTTAKRTTTSKRTTTTTTTTADNTRDTRSY